MSALKRIAGIGLDPKGFLYRRDVDDRMIAVMPLLFGRARLGIGPQSAEAFSDVWDYPSRARAIAAAEAWDPELEDEPDGWHRHAGTGRRRPDGDPAREYTGR